MAELKIKADSGGGTVSFKGPSTTTSNAAVQLTLPVDDGTANQTLTTNGSGVLSWAAPVIADDSLTEAKLDIHAAPSGTDKFLGYTSNGMEWATVTSGWNLVGSSNTSVGTGTSYTHTGISATAKQVYVVFKDISYDGANHHSFRIGPSGGVVTSGYNGQSLFVGNSTQGTNNTTDCFRFIGSDNAAYRGTGYIHLINFTGNIWIASGWMSLANSSGTSGIHYFFNGHCDVGGTLDRVQFYPDSSANLDDGEVTVYEI